MRKPWGRLVPAACLATIAALAACESTPPGAGTAPLPVPEVTTVPYPAVAPDVPQVLSSGGPVMDKPKIVLIVYPNDDLLSQIQSFAGRLGASEYWHRIGVEYGVGPITLLQTIQRTDAPQASIMDSDIQSFLQTNLAVGSGSGWPQPDGNTIYALFYPSTTAINDGSGQMSCTDFGGYHLSTARLTDGAVISYAVLPRCTGTNQAPIDTLTIAASHEFIETSTDPAPLDNPAYLGVDDNHLVWQFELSGGNELADMCEFFPAADIKPDDLGFTVQRSWSNEAATQGQNPCVPAATTPEPYVYVTPVNPPDTVPFDIFMQQGTTLGYPIAVGQSRTIDLSIISSAPTNGPIYVSYAERDVGRSTTPSLTITSDQTSGENGTRVHLTITPSAPSSSHFGFTPFAVEATYGDEGFLWFGLVQAH